MPDAPKDNLYRGMLNGCDFAAVESRSADDSGSTLYGHFTPFDTWSRIDSWFEGTFMERTVPGAFKKTIKDDIARMVVQYDHGHDPYVGDGPVAVIEVLREEDFGPYYEGALLDTEPVRSRVLPLLQGRTIDGRNLGSQLGASYRFRVTREEWVHEPKASEFNPEAIPERTIREVQLYEFGPVVFPAFPDATAKVRCLTDHYLDRQRERRSAHRIGAPSSGSPADTETTTPALDHLVGQQGRLVASARTSLLALRSAHQ